MSAAPGHLLGQHIGSILEAALKPVLLEMSDKYDLFLDTYGPRPGVRAGSKVSWSDSLGNSHDLDFVIERGGTPTVRGNPAVFLEAAWRRYGKHSKAKAQEIQGAVLPVLAAWSNVGPVPAAVVAGEWTRPALQQMVSSGFSVLHLNFTATVSAFAEFGVDIRGRDGTDDAFWEAQTTRLETLGVDGRAQIAARLYSNCSAEIDAFIDVLVKRVIRQVARVEITPLHGNVLTYLDVNSAVEALSSYRTPSISDPFVRFEIRVHYSNGDRIEAEFARADDAVRFLETFD
jgi:hypothetical protein